MSKKALGKGIDALLGDDTPATGGLPLAVALDSLKPNPHQPRQSFSEQSLRDLADSIREKGVLQPILVEAATGGGYTIIAGERRARAAKLAGLSTIPVVVKEFSPQEKLEIALIENIQREDLTPMETASAYRRLMDLGSLNQEQLAQRIGKERSTVANMLRLLKLPPEAQAALADGSITAGHARALLMLSNTAQVPQLLKRIVDAGLSVRDAEEAAGQLNAGRRGAVPAGERGAAPRQDPHLHALEQQLIEKLGTKVEVRGSPKSGRIEISWFSADDLDRLIEILT